MATGAVPPTTIKEREISGLEALTSTGRLIDYRWDGLVLHDRASVCVGSNNFYVRRHLGTRRMTAFYRGDGDVNSEALVAPAAPLSRLRFRFLFSSFVVLSG